MTKTLPGYTYLADLGGGQADTWLAEKGGKEVVIKTLELARVEDWKGIELFEREIATLRQLNHPPYSKIYRESHRHARRQKTLAYHSRKGLRGIAFKSPRTQ